MLSVYCLELLASAAQYLIFASFTRICEDKKVPELRSCIQMVNCSLQNLTLMNGESGVQAVEINLFAVRLDRGDNIQRQSQSAASIF